MTSAIFSAQLLDSSETRCTNDQKFEKMCEILLKFFASIKSLMPFLRSSLRQTMIRKLSKVGKDKEAWKRKQRSI